MKDLKWNPGLLCIAIFIIVMIAGCQATNWNANRFPYSSGYAPSIESTTPDLGAPSPDPSATMSEPPQTFSTERPQTPVAPQWEKSVPLIRGSIDLGTPSKTPPAEMLPHEVRSVQPVVPTIVAPQEPSATAVPSLGPQLPLFVDEPAGEPQFTVEMPAEALQNEPVSVKVEVWNADKKTRGPLRLTLVRPETVHNLSPLGDEIVFDALKAGERRSQTLSIAVAAPGEQCLEWKLSESEREIGWKKVCLTGRASKLDAMLIGPKTKPLGQRAEFTLSVVNTSAEPVGNISAVLEHDRAIVPVEASEGAEQRPGQLAWKIPVLQPGEALYLQVEFDCPLETGSACVTADVTADELPTIHRKSCLAVERTAGSLQVVLSDQNDLARVGQNVTVIMRVTNFGLQPARKLVGELVLPAGLDLSDYTVYRGNEVVPLPSQVEEGILRFESVGELLSDQSLEYRVVLQTKSAGSFEMIGRMTDELRTTPVSAKEPLTVTP